MYCYRTFINEYGTHYMKESWLGAKVTTLTWMSSRSKNSLEQLKRRQCLKDAYSKSTQKGVKLNNFDVNVSVHIFYYTIIAISL